MNPRLAPLFVVVLWMLPSCKPATPALELENNRWRPVRIGIQAVGIGDGEREPWILLDPRERRVTGSGGCNRISGTYEAGDGALRFGPIISTKMACPGVDTETPFLAALESTRRYRIDGRTLELLDEHGTLLAQLEERNLK